MATITNNNIISISKGVYKCPCCKKFFGVKKLNEQEIETINAAGKCLACLEKEQEEQVMQNELTEVVDVDTETQEVAINDDESVSESTINDELCHFEAENDSTNTEALVDTSNNRTAFKRDERGKLDTVVIPTNGELIIPGPRGITKHQMLAAIIREIDSPDNLLTLYKSYPFTYEGSLRYLKSAERQAAKVVIPSPSGENNDKNKLKLIQLLQPARKGITRHQIICLLERCVMKEDYEVIQQIIKYFPEQFQGSLRYIAKKDYPVIETALEMYLASDATQNKQLMATA